MYEWRLYAVWESLDLLGQGLLLTFRITGVSILFGMALGVVVAAGRLSKNIVISKFFAGYVEIFRCTPLLVLIIWGFYCLPVFLKVRLPAVTTGIIVLTLYGSMLYGEGFRAGIQAVPSEQRDAATALGLSPIQSFVHVVLPQAFRIVIPPLLSFSATIFKESSLLSVIGVNELMLNARMVAAWTYRALEALTVAALIYAAVAYPITVVVRILERKMRLKIGVQR